MWDVIIGSRSARRCVWRDDFVPILSLADGERLNDEILIPLEEFEGACWL